MARILSSHSATPGLAVENEDWLASRSGTGTRLRRAPVPRVPVRIFPGSPYDADSDDRHPRSSPAGWIPGSGAFRRSGCGHEFLTPLDYALDARRGEGGTEAVVDIGASCQALVRCADAPGALDPVHAHTRPCRKAADIGTIQATP